VMTRRVFGGMIATRQSTGEIFMAANFADWLAICETKARYCRCLDTKDWAGYADCFTEDFVIELPPEGNTHRGRDAAIAYIRGTVDDSVTTHHVHNPEVMFDGEDAADVIWALQDRNTWSERRRAAMGNRGHTGYGHYRERYVRCADGRWRIAHQVLSYLQMDILPG
jgi:ketosteroid isomerase-like protein